MKDLIVCVCKSQKNQIKMNLAVGNEKRNSSKMGLMLFVEGSTLREQSFFWSSKKNQEKEDRKETTRRVGRMYRVTENIRVQVNLKSM